MNKSDLKSLTENLIETFNFAGKESIRIFKEGLKIQIKGDNSPVSNGDLKVNEIISGKISQLTPNIPIISEETVDLNKKNKSKVDSQNACLYPKCIFGYQTCFFWYQTCFWYQKFMGTRKLFGTKNVLAQKKCLDQKCQKITKNKECLTNYILQKYFQKNIKNKKTNFKNIKNLEVIKIIKKAKINFRSS